MTLKFMVPLVLLTVLSACSMQETTNQTPDKSAGWITRDVNFCIANDTEGDMDIASSSNLAEIVMPESIPSGHVTCYELTKFFPGGIDLTFDEGMPLRVMAGNPTVGRPQILICQIDHDCTIALDRLNEFSLYENTTLPEKVVEGHNLQASRGANTASLINLTLRVLS